jgi:hypothetical protein
MIAAFSSPLLPSVSSRSLDWRGNPVALLVRTSTNARPAMPTFCMPDARPIQLGLLRTFSIRAWTIATRSGEGTRAGQWRWDYFDLEIQISPCPARIEILDQTKRALSRSSFFARDRRARNYFRTHDLFYLAFPMKGCEQGDDNEAK